VPTESKKKKNLKKIIFVDILKITNKKSRVLIRIRNQEYGSKDPDPYQKKCHGSGTLSQTHAL
jgi:hypothetical protein